jgi:hypothetical protein
MKAIFRTAGGQAGLTATLLVGALIGCASVPTSPPAPEQGRWTGPCNTVESSVQFTSKNTFSLESAGSPLIGSNYDINGGVLRINTDSRDGWTYSGPVTITGDHLDMTVTLSGPDQGVLPAKISCALVLKTRKTDLDQ